MVEVAWKQRADLRAWVCDDCGALWEKSPPSCSSYTLFDEFAARFGLRASWEDLTILSDDYDTGERDSLEGRVSASDPDADIKRRANDGTLRKNA